MATYESTLVLDEEGYCIAHRKTELQTTKEFAISTQQTAQTQYIKANGIRYAYRRFGLTTGVPLDPDLINPLAKTRPILLVNLAGVGLSSGEVGAIFADWPADVVAIVEGLGIKQIDLPGFSMGGMVAQMVALNAPHLVRRLILAGTGPSVGEGVEQGPAWAFEILYPGSTAVEVETTFLKAFYSQSEEKQALGKQWLARVNERQVDGIGYLGPDGTAKQTGVVISLLTLGNPGHSYERLDELKIPVFVAAEDIVVPTANSIVLWRRIKTAHLHVYPDVGHGFLNEYAGMFAEHINFFLDRERVM